ncbi:MAG: beta-ketoacyl synthase chain length factor, partial [Paludibacteraceae bacterium]|nr:beta-ketoacyl synthase chain length factor [Paludibacteraceae bacterium]
MSCYIKKVSTVSPIGDLGENLNLNTFAANNFNAVEPDYKEVIANANLRRRMNRMLKMGTYAAMKCLADTDVDMMLTATSLGSISDTEKMLDTIYSSGETLGNPTAFIQSTFNTLAGNIAQLKSTHIPNVTFVNRGETVANALGYAQVKLSCDADNILYVSSDEKTELSETVLKKFNLSANGMYGEGSTAMILSSEKTGALAEIVFSKCGIDVMSALKELGMTMEDVEILDYKRWCGEYATALAFGVALAARMLEFGMLEGKTHVAIEHRYGHEISVVVLR